MSSKPAVAAQPPCLSTKNNRIFFVITDSLRHQEKYCAVPTYQPINPPTYQHSACKKCGRNIGSRAHVRPPSPPPSPPPSQCPSSSSSLAGGPGPPRLNIPRN